MTTRSFMKPTRDSSSERVSRARLAVISRIVTSPIRYANDTVFDTHVSVIRKMYRCSLARVAASFGSRRQRRIRAVDGAAKASRRSKDARRRTQAPRLKASIVHIGLATLFATNPRVHGTDVVLTAS